MNRTMRIVCALLAVALLVGITGCSKDAAATVNGETIKKSEIDQQLAQLKQQYPQLFQEKDGKQRENEFRKRLLDNAVNQMLVKQEAAKQGISVSDADIQKQIDELIANFGTKAQFEEALKKNNMTLDKLKEQEKIQLETQKLIDKVTKGITISDKEMRDYYDKNKTMFVDKASVHAAHILFDEKDRALATKTLAEVKASPGRFAELAKKYSKDPASAAKGGDLGWPSTPYVQEFQKALDQTKAGQLDPNLVKTQFGWHIIKVVEKKKETTKSFAEVKDQIKQILMQQRQADAFQKLLDELKKKAKIEYPKA